MPAKKKQAPAQDTNAWITTYTDLMTLLLTFFVLLLSMSVVDVHKKKLALNSLVGAFGFKPGAHSVIGSPEGLNITVGGAPMEPETVQFEKLRNMAMKNSISVDAQVLREQEKTVIRLGHRVLFKRGSSQINPDSLGFLSALADVVREGPRLIELRGFCAFEESAFKAEPLRTAMILSSNRAMAVYEFLRREAGIPGDRLVAHGFGVSGEGAGNSQEKGLDRQVEIILDYRERVPFHMQKSRRNGSLLDFKGFFFRIPGDDLHDR